MVLIILSALFSIAILGMCYSASREGAGHVIAVAISGGFFCMLFAAGVGFIAVFLQCAITLVLALLCWPFHPSRKVLIGCCFLAAVAANAFSIRVGMTRVQTLRNLREEYPVVSLVDRLEYETIRAKHPGIKPGNITTPTTPPAGRDGNSASLSVFVENRLQSFDQTGSRFREYKLKQLHDHKQEQFVFAQGFGITRMGSVYKESVEQKEAPPIPLPEKREYEPSLEQDRRLVELNPAPPLSLLNEVHDASLGDFLNRDRFGSVESRDRVTGFSGHQFSRMPLNGATTDTWGIEPITWEQWQIQKLELVSLLRHEQPRVYVSENLPRMDQLHDAKTRPLNAFESGALPKLATEQDLVIDDSDSDRILMLGALRAGNECRKCHFIDRGHLLGAFSYELVRSSSPGGKRATNDDEPSL